LHIFRKSVGKLQFSLKSDKNNVYFTWRRIYIFDHISLNSFGIKNLSDRCCREIRNTHFMLNNFFSKIIPFMR